MALSLLISTLSGLVEVAEYCHKIDRIKLRAGFPFSDFEIPTFKYSVLKTKLDSLFLNRDDFITTVSGRGLKKAEFKSVVENKNVKGKDFYSIECTLDIKKLDFNNYQDKDDDTVSWIGFWAELFFRTEINLSDIEYIDFNTSVYDLYGVLNDIRFRTGISWENLYLKREGSYNTDFDLIKRALTSFRWIFSNTTPRLANYDNSGAILTRISLIDPYLWDIGNAFILDEELIIKQAEEVSWAGFKIERDIIDKDEVDLRPINDTQNQLGFPDYWNNKKNLLEYEPQGSGKQYSINLISPPEDIYIEVDGNRYNLMAEYGAYLEASRIASYYRTHIKNRKLTIETRQDTNIVPYRSITLGSRKYYCIGAELDIRDYGKNKYILQERWI